MRILFVNSVCSRNGSTLMLLYFLEWLKNRNPEYVIDVISPLGGSVSDEFDKTVNNHYKLYRKKSFTHRIFRAAFRKTGIIKLTHPLIYNYEISFLKKNNYDLIYNNTIFNLELALLIKEKCGIPHIILHMHEMKNFISQVYQDFSKFIPSIDLFICASGAVQRDLTEKWKVKNTEVIYELSKIENRPKKKIIDPSNIVISGSGRGAHRKGLDLFIETCYHISTQNYNCRFQWLGHLTDDELDHHRKLVNSFNLENRFTFLKEREEITSFYEETSIFLMTSREDPFPLVCIEAGNFGIPILLFDKCTGTQEVFEDLDYLITDPYNLEEMSTKVLELVTNPIFFEKTSKLMSLRFSKFTVENQSKKIIQQISFILSK